MRNVSKSQDFVSCMRLKLHGQQFEQAYSGRPKAVGRLCFGSQLPRYLALDTQRTLGSSGITNQTKVLR